MAHFSFCSRVDTDGYQWGNGCELEQGTDQWAPGQPEDGATAVRLKTLVSKVAGGGETPTYNYSTVLYGARADHSHRPLCQSGNNLPGCVLSCLSVLLSVWYDVM